MSLEHTTSALLVPRSTNWANVPFDTNVQEINIFKHLKYAIFFKKRKQSKYNSGPYEFRTQDLTVISITLYRLS